MENQIEKDLISPRKGLYLSDYNGEKDIFISDFKNPFYDLEGGILSLGADNISAVLKNKMLESINLQSWGGVKCQQQQQFQGQQIFQSWGEVEQQGVGDLKLQEQVSVYSNSSCSKKFSNKNTQQGTSISESLGGGDSSASQKLKRTKFTKEEDLIIIECLQQFGKKWGEISKRLAGRSPTMIRNRYYAKLRKNQSEGIQDEEEKEKDRDQKGKQIQNQIQRQAQIEQQVKIQLKNEYLANKIITEMNQDTIQNHELAEFFSNNYPKATPNLYQFQQQQQQQIQNHTTNYLQNSSLLAQELNQNNQTENNDNFLYQNWNENHHTNFQDLPEQFQEKITDNFNFNFNCQNNANFPPTNNFISIEMDSQLDNLSIVDEAADMPKFNLNPSPSTILNLSQDPEEKQIKIKHLHHQIQEIEGMLEKCKREILKEFFSQNFLSNNNNQDPNLQMQNNSNIISTFNLQQNFFQNFSIQNQQSNTNQQ